MKIIYNIFEIRPGKYSVYTNLTPAFIIYTAFDSRDKESQLSIVDAEELKPYHTVISRAIGANTYQNRCAYVDFLLNYDPSYKWSN